MSVERVKFGLMRLLRRRRNFVSRSRNHQTHPSSKESLFMALPIGSEAPDFTLKSKQGDEIIDVRLGGLPGQIKCCTALLSARVHQRLHLGNVRRFSRVSAEYEALNAKVIGISVDSPFAQAAWAKQEKIKITLASDLNKETGVRLRHAARESWRIRLSLGARGDRYR